MKVIHIGFPKTATTYLQTMVFPRLAGSGYVDLGKEAYARLFSSLIDDDDTIFDADRTATDIWQHAGSQANALLSHERLTGADYRSGFVNRTQIAHRLKRVGFDRVIITIRNQFDVLESAYKQHVRSGGVLRFRDYLSLDSESPRYLHPRYFDYGLAYDLYATLFGSANVLVLQYEDMAEPRFAAALTAFLGTPEASVSWARPANESLSVEKTAVLRVLNHLTYSPHRPSSLLPRKMSTRVLSRGLSALPFGNSRRSFLDETTRASIAGLFADSNRRLAEAAAITLAPEYP